MEAILLKHKNAVEQVYHFRKEGIFRKLTSENFNEKVHNQIRMELNILENSTKPILYCIETLLHINSLFNSGFIDIESLSIGKNAYENQEQTLNSTISSQMVWKLLKECDASNDIPGYLEWSLNIDEIYSHRNDSVIIHIYD